MISTAGNVALIWEFSCRHGFRCAGQSQSQTSTLPLIGVDPDHMTYPSDGTVQYRDVPDFASLKGPPANTGEENLTENGSACAYRRLVIPSVVDAWPDVDCGWTIYSWLPHLLSLIPV